MKPRQLSRGATYAFLIAAALLMIAPFLWSISTSLKQPGDVFAYPPRFLPDPVTFQNYVDAASSVIDAGACGVHIDFSWMTDESGQRLDRLPPVEAYSQVLEPLRKRKAAAGDMFEVEAATAVFAPIRTLCAIWI